jgi:hypothetical protein
LQNSSNKIAILKSGICSASSKLLSSLHSTTKHGLISAQRK